MIPAGGFASPHSELSLRMLPEGRVFVLDYLITAGFVPWVSHHGEYVSMRVIVRSQAAATALLSAATAVRTMGWQPRSGALSTDDLMWLEEKRTQWQ